VCVPIYAFVSLCTSCVRAMLLQPTALQSALEDACDGLSLEIFRNNVAESMNAQDVNDGLVPIQRRTICSPLILIIVSPSTRLRLTCEISSEHVMSCTALMNSARYIWSANTSE